MGQPYIDSNKTQEMAFVQIPQLTFEWFTKKNISTAKLARED